MPNISNEPENYEQLSNELSKDNQVVGEVLTELKEELKDKYGIIKGTTLNLTHLEVSSLKDEVKKISKKDSIKSHLKHAIYDEYIETKLEGINGVSNISLDLVTENINNTRINETKDILGKYVEKFTDKYDFLGENEKEVFKLAMANKILGSFSPIEMLNISKNITKIGEGIKNFSYDTIKSAIGEVTSEFSSIQKKLESNFSPYEKLFDKVKSDLDKGNYSSQKKINIISNLDWFHNPQDIEDYEGEGLIFDYEKVKGKPLKLSIDNIEIVKQYLIKSRNKIDKLGEKLDMGTKAKKMVLDAVTNPDFGEYIEKGLGWLLKIPFIGQLIAVFLGLTPDKPLESLQEEKEIYKTYKNLIRFGGKSDKDGNITTNSDSKIDILADKDLSELDYEKIKPDLLYINQIKKKTPIAESTSTKDVTKKDKKTDSIDETFIKIFGTDGLNGLKIKLTSNCFTNNKPNNKFYKKFNEGIKEHKNIEENIINKAKTEKYKKVQESITKDNNKKLISIQNDINSSDSILQDDFLKYTKSASAVGATISSFVDDNRSTKQLFGETINKFEKIDDIYQYRSILISELPESDSDIQNFLIKKLGKDDWEDELKGDQKSLILFIKQVKKHKDISEFETIGDALEKKDDIIKEYKDKLIEEENKIKKKNTLLINLSNAKGSLISGIQEKELYMKLDGNILTFNNEKFSFELPSGVSITNLTFDNQDASIKINLLSNPIKVKREIINLLILEASINNKSEYSKNGITIKLNKVIS